MGSLFYFGFSNAHRPRRPIGANDRERVLIAVTAWFGPRYDLTNPLRCDVYIGASIASS